MKKSVYLFLFISLFAFMSCSDSTGGNEIGDDPPLSALTYFTLETTIAGNHTNSYALSVKNLVEYAAYDLALVELILSAGHIPWENKGDHWEYTFVESNETLTLKLWPESDAYRLEWYVSGTDGSGTILEISQAKDGKSGYMNLFNIDEEPPYKEVFLNWTFNENNDFSGIITSYYPSGDVEDIVNIFVKNDHTGNYNIKEDGDLTEEAVWFLDGSGSVTYYYLGNGTVYNWGPNPAVKMSPVKRNIDLDIFQVYKNIVKK